MNAHSITALLLVVALLLLSATASSAQATCEPAASNRTSANSTNTQIIIGVALTIIPTICFGSNYIPVKSFETGDGVFFQWVMSVAILIGGFITYCIQHFPTFYVEAAIGGAIWSLGNVCVVPIVKLVGLSIGFLIWAMTSMVVGWAMNTFGLFGVDRKVLCYPIMNYIGVAVCVVGGVMIAFVQPTLDRKGERGSNTEKAPLIQINNESKILTSSSTCTSYKTINADNKKIQIENNSRDDLACVESLHPIFRKLLGVGLGFMSGTFYGFMFLPISLMTTQSHNNNNNNNTYYSPDSIDYAFPYTVGIFLMGTLVLVVYCFIKLNKPSINPQVLLPGLFSGGLWAAGALVWIYVNGILSSSITFPIVSSGPPIISSIWGILVFREIRGKKNLFLFILSFIFILCGVLLVTLSEFNL